VEYTIRKIADLAGISTRTLRYYESVGLLAPERMNSSGYRIYGQAQVDRLQIILFFRELGLSLAAIRGILESDTFDSTQALREHRSLLLERKKQLDKLIANVEKTIEVQGGSATMTDSEKFEGLSQKMIEENEAKYGKEIRSRYGNETVDQSNDKLKKMTKEDHMRLESLTRELGATLKAACEQGDPTSALAQKACELHKKWLMYYWPQYSKENHLALTEGYVCDPRFTAYYDQIAPGSAVFLRDAMRKYLGAQ